MTNIFLRIVVILTLLASALRAQQTEPEPQIAPPATTPTTSPDSEPTTRPGRAAEIPPGYQRMEIEGRQIILDPNDEIWVRTALASIQPATMPSTMPADLLDKLDARREALKARIMQDLALSDPKPIDEFFDQRMKEFLQRMDEYRPPIVYLVTTEPRLKQMMKAGWTDPLFHYNRAGDYVSYRTQINLAPGLLDDTLVPILYDPKTGTEPRGQRAIQTVGSMEAEILRKLADLMLSETTIVFVDVISGLAISPLELKPDQEWFGVGVSGVLAARYTAQLSDADAEQLLDRLSLDTGRNPIRPGTIDVLKPPRVADLRPEALGAYLDAYRRRAMQIVRSLYQRGGEDAVPKVLVEFRKSPPADGPALIKLIEKTSGVDLSAEIAVQR